MPLLTAQLRKEHAKLMPHVDELRVIADYAAEVPLASLQERLRREHEFLVGEFVPHMEAEQATLLPVMEELLPDRHSFQHAHGEIRQLIAALEQPRRSAAEPGASEWVLGQRRALYQLYALLKVHLAEEELYTPILERQLTAAQETELAARLEFGAPPAGQE